MDEVLKDNIAIITGAGRGIGKATAIKLAEKGADIVVVDVIEENAVKVVNEIKAMGRNAIYINGDVTKKEDAESIMNTAVKELGGIHILVNNAGITKDAMLHKMTAEEWQKVIDVNLTGVFNCLQAAALYMRNQEYGRIINISSVSREGNIGQLNYSASKAGVVGITKTASKELARKNITVNAICPGFINTEMVRAMPKKVIDIMLEKIPMGRMGKPEEIANLIGFLASKEAAYITGEVITVGGGLRL